MKQEEILLQEELLDVISERPYPFTVGKKHFYLYPVTLGKTFLLKRQIENLQINQENIQKNVNLEILRVVKEKREVCCTILAYHTCKTKEELFSTKIIAERRNLFDREATEEDLTTIMITLLANDKTELFMKNLKIDLEQKRIRKALEIKNRTDKNSLSFGGKSLYGSFIHPLLELGLSWNEIVWERSYINLRLLLADKPNSMFLSDDERKKMPVWVLDNNATVLSGDKNNKEVLKQQDWT